MIRSSFTLAALSLAVLAGCDNAPKSTPSDTATTMQTQQTEKPVSAVAPIAKKVPHEMTIHGDTRIDDYYWLRDDERKAPDVISYLNAENVYTEAMLAHTQTLQDKLFEELKGRIKKDDDSVPVKKGDYFYSSQTRGENEYPTYVRSSDFKGTDQQVILDVNALAKDHDYFAVSGLSVSTNGNLMAYGEDTVSRRIYTIKVKDLTTGQLLEDTLEGTNGGVIWANDNKTFYYIKKDAQTLLGYQVFRHTLGTPQSDDELIYEEADTSYYTGISKSKDGSEIYIWHSSTNASGMSVLSADDNKAKPKRLIEREDDLEYSISKLGNTYYIVTNLNAVNFQLMKVDVDKAHDKANWQTVIAPRDDIKLEGVDLFKDYLVYQERELGQSRLIVRHLSTTTPVSSYDIDLKSGDKTLLKQQAVLGDFNADNYASERIFIKARDGIKVPVSLVYRKDTFKKEGTNPLLQYGYGSYGATMDPTFSSSRLSLLDRGFVFAIAHVRGSQMLGRPWYEDGKLLTKKNTFNDFVDVTKSLVAQGYGAKDEIFAYGGSAGGLLPPCLMQAYHLLPMSMVSGVTQMKKNITITCCRTRRMIKSQSKRILIC